MVITTRQGVAITPSTQNWSSNDFYNTNHSKIDVGMNFIIPSTPKCTWCYNHPLLYLKNCFQRPVSLACTHNFCERCLPPDSVSDCPKCRRWDSRVKSYSDRRLQGSKIVLKKGELGPRAAEWALEPRSFCYKTSNHREFENPFWISVLRFSSQKFKTQMIYYIWHNGCLRFNRSSKGTRVKGSATLGYPGAALAT